MDHDWRGSNKRDLIRRGENLNLVREVAKWRVEQGMHKGELFEQSWWSSIQVLQRIISTVARARNKNGSTYRNSSNHDRSIVQYPTK